MVLQQQADFFLKISLLKFSLTSLTSIDLYESDETASEKMNNIEQKKYIFIL